MICKCKNSISEVEMYNANGDSRMWRLCVTLGVVESMC
jgi:hypothetical protein